MKHWSEVNLPIRKGYHALAHFQDFPRWQPRTYEPPNEQLPSLGLLFRGNEPASLVAVDAAEVFQSPRLEAELEIVRSHEEERDGRPVIVIDEARLLGVSMNG